MKYIHFTNWEKSQRYKYRNNPWIRLYVEIIEKYDKDGQEKKFFKIKDLSRANFLCLLCAAGKFNNRIPYENDKELKRITGLKRVYLEELLQCNYIFISSDVTEKCAEVVQESDQSVTESCSTVTDTVTVTEVDHSAFALPDKETINEASEPMIEDLINQISDELYYKEIFPDAPKFKNTMKKAAKNPRAMLHAFIRCYIKKPPVKEAWGYCVQILKTENGNYNEREYTKSA
jgi:hypothetical protein